MRVLVVGQGLAGTLVSHAALGRGWDCHVVDSGQTSASAVAAGMYNPMSFRRIVEVWDAAEHLASMRRTYTAIETLLGDRFLHPLPILKRIPNEEYAAEWNRKTESLPWIEPVQSDLDIRLRFPDAPPSAGHGYGVVQGGGWLNLPRLIESWRERLTEEGRISHTRWDQADLEPTIQAGWDAVIDCRGTAAADDPNGRIDIRANRGEILTIQQPSGSNHQPLPADHILNFGKWTLPIAAGQWRLGASYEWNRKDLNPTGETANFLLDSMHSAAPASAPVDIVRHDVGLRPVSRDRRPAVGPWPARKGLFVFNGLGTRGVLIGPRWAHILCDIVNGERQPPDIVDPKRLVVGL